ncbi:MAG: DUF192 domain-containing protein [Candidatus Micrarchaeota archaeon]|nr:DUF192 domain-containing protein [Candidatus Micrarchaeota archaeon]
MEEKASKRICFVAFLLLLAILFASFAWVVLMAEKPNAVLTNLSKSKSERVYLEVADSDFARMRGLMFRQKIVPILFIFDSDGKHPIHSHFVKSEFDAIYLSSGKEVVAVARRIQPNLSWVEPPKENRYLLELPPELTDRLSIEEGDRLEWRIDKQQA